MPKVVNMDKVVINSSGNSDSSVNRLISFSRHVKGSTVVTALCGTGGTPFKKDTSIKVWGTGAATRGTKAHGPMG